MARKRRKLPAPSDAQLEILNVIWELGEATVGDVLTAISSRRDVARNTVQTLMTRLDEKGWLTHKRRGQAFIYRATVPRDVARKQLAEHFVEAAFEGSCEGLVLALLDGRPLDKETAERIRSLVDDAERRRR